MLRHLPLILKNGTRNKRRSILTILSIAASLCLLGILMVLYHVFFLQEASPEQALRLWVRNRVSLANPLPLSYRERIRQVPGVQEAIVFQWFGGTYKDARDPANFFGRFGVEAEKLAVLYPEYRLSDDERKAFIAERSACIVGRKTAERLKLKIGEKVTLVGDIFPVTLNLTIRGIYDAPRDNENMLFHWAYLNETLKGTGRDDVVGTFVLRMDKPESATPISKAIDDMFRNSPQQTKTETERAFEIGFMAFLGNVKAFLLAICGAVVFTILLVSGNTMAMAVRERIREVGILKTVGFSNGAILSLLVGESVFIALAGGALGLLLAAGALAGMRAAPSTFADMSRMHLTPAIALIGLLTAAMIGVISSLIPAWGASRRSIVDALRVTD